MRVSQASISQQVGVSRTAVSHVLNGREHMVSEETRQRIMEVVEASGYHRNAIVRALKTSRSHVIGIVVAEAALSRFADLIHHVERAARLKGFQCFLRQTKGEAEALERSFAMLREYRVDGLLLLASGLSAKGGRKLPGRGFPFVSIDPLGEEGKGAWVGCDHFQAGWLAARHLLEQGHRRILFLGGPDERLGHRLKGYRRALAQAGIAEEEALVRAEGVFTFAEGRAAAERLLERPGDWTAVMTSSDFVAAGLIQRFSEAGYRIPRDFAVIGCGDFGLSIMATPALTTIDLRLAEVGAAALEMLMAQIEGREAHPAPRMIEPQLRVRESTAPVPDAGRRTGGMRGFTASARAT